MSNALNFQDIILKLLDFWKEAGCLVLQPYNVQVGAGTMNPATALRVLGPEPWNVVYVEPSIRPDDGRFGDNPNRLQMHHQLQVILKPDPGNPQELFLQSLEAIGINPLHHDIRFVEDNWESPALGAWGLGWEVWLDGQEITQFTYFQQAGGQTLDPVSVEITYGLDRIVLALQQKSSVWEIEYGRDIAYAELLLQSEIEHCEYYFNVADVDHLRQLYALYEQEAQHAVAAGLVVPAHDYNLKCSHVFNVLDTRGAIGVTERAAFFGRMRNMARQISELYVAQREKLGHPLLQPTEKTAVSPPPATVQPTTEHTLQTLLLELGSEELPVTELSSMIYQLQARVPELLDELRLEYGRIEVEGTPRRVMVLVHLLATQQSEETIVLKGPPADRAYDSEGKPTRAAIGFAQANDLDLDDLTIQDIGDKQYVTAVKQTEGQSAFALLQEALPKLIAELSFARSMRWNSSNVRYSRPLRWIVALLGPDILQFTYADVPSGRVSRGLRPYGSPDIRISDARNYIGIMRKNGVILQIDKRKEMIAQVASKLAAEKKGHLQNDDALLTEVANLVERPTPMRGEFDPKFLELPEVVLVAVMRKHQRYFPVYNDNQQLLPFFLAVRNGNERHLDIVVRGNEQVLRARFQDATFFYQKDCRQPIDAYLPQLETLTFQAELGSMLDKTKRLQKLAPLVGAALGLSEATQTAVFRAATLAKADLATEIVVEMTALQGIMGGHYAHRSGESMAVAEAISEQYETVSQTAVGLALALADRLDSLVGLFAAGLRPKGSNDPFALRRMARQLIENMIVNEVELVLQSLLKEAAALQPVPVEEGVLDEVAEFVNGRLDSYLREQGHSSQVVQAVLAANSGQPLTVCRSAAALTRAIDAEQWPALLDAYARCVRITRDEPAASAVNESLLVEDAEQVLWASVKTAVVTDMRTFLYQLHRLAPLIGRFFDTVLVMDTNLARRQNRLALLYHIASLPRPFADLSYLDGF